MDPRILDQQGQSRDRQLHEDDRTDPARGGVDHPLHDRHGRRPPDEPPGVAARHNPHELPEQGARGLRVALQPCVPAREVLQLRGLPGLRALPELRERHGDRQGQWQRRRLQRGHVLVDARARRVPERPGLQVRSHQPRGRWQARHLLHQRHRQDEGRRWRPHSVHHC